MEQSLDKAVIEREAKDLVSDVTALIITTPAKYEFAGTLLTLAVGLEKKVRDVFDPDIKKANDLHKSMIKTRDAMLKPILSAGAILRNKRNEFRERIEAKQEKEVAKNGVAKTPEPPKTEGISQTEYWTFRITDPKLIPDEYKIVDEKRLGLIARSLKDKAIVPGVEFYSYTSDRVCV